MLFIWGIPAERWQIAFLRFRPVSLTSFFCAGTCVRRGWWRAENARPGPARSSSTHSTLLPNRLYIYIDAAVVIYFFFPLLLLLSFLYSYIVCCTLCLLYLSLAVSWLPFARYIIGCTNAHVYSLFLWMASVDIRSLYHLT